jgi:hypothetical protein
MTEILSFPGPSQVRKSPPLDSSASIISFPEIAITSCAHDGWLVCRRSHAWSFGDRASANDAARELAALCGERARTT